MIRSTASAGRRFGFGVERAVCLTELHRLMVSGSARHASEWRTGLHVPHAEESDLDQAYKAMAWIGTVDEEGHGIADAIKEALYYHRLSILARPLRHHQPLVREGRFGNVRSA